MDVKPVIESIFMLHARAKQDAKEKHPTYEVKSNEQLHFWHRVNEVFIAVNKKFDESLYPAVKWPAKSEQCKEPISTNAAPIAVDHRQPYGTLVLADLIQAHGSPDEAIAVLVEWLNLSDAFEQTDTEKEISKWWQLRVMSRVAILMSEVAGQNNLAYREFFNAYQKKLETYFGERKIRLDDLPARCKTWPRAASQNSAFLGASARFTGSESNSNERDFGIEQKAYYLLLEAEDEALRTEVNFIGEEGKVERLENLYRRAEFLASVGVECLPASFEDHKRKGLTAEHQVTAGLVGLSVADRMTTIALSRGDRDRATVIAQDGEKALRAGFGTLSWLVDVDRNEIKKSANWSDRVFHQSDWERSASMAARASLRLRSKSD